MYKRVPQHISQSIVRLEDVFLKCCGVAQDTISNSVNYAKQHKIQVAIWLASGILLGGTMHGIVRNQSDMLEAIYSINKYSKQPALQQEWIDYALKEAELANSFKGLIPFYMAIWKNQKPTAKDGAKLKDTIDSKL